MAYFCTACAVRVTIFSMGGKFRPVSNFTELHALALAARSYVLLVHSYVENVVHTVSLYIAVAYLFIKHEGFKAQMM